MTQTQPSFLLRTDDIQPELESQLSSLDNIYQVASTQTVNVNVIGVGTTAVRRVFTNIVGYSTESFSSTLITFDSTVYTFDDQTYEDLTLVELEQHSTLVVSVGVN